MAYGARLESVLGSRPRGFESRILRAAEQRQRRATRPRGGPAFAFRLQFWLQSRRQRRDGTCRVVAGSCRAASDPGTSASISAT